MTSWSCGLCAALLVALAGCEETVRPRPGGFDGGPVTDAANDLPFGDLLPAGDGTATADAAGDSAVDAGPWQLVWSDEFNTPGLPDPTKWDYEEGYVRNNEAQYYTKGRSENARVENGTLVIEARRDYFQGHEYTSASVITAGKASWTHGRVEVRAKLPTGTGMWPAIWMLGTNITSVGWPTCGEIDIMENVGFEPDRIYGTVHTQAFNHTAGTAKGDHIDLTADPPYQSFHRYAIEWYADRIDFYVDSSKYFSFANTGNGTAEWPFDKPQYLILNVAVGGSWGGQQGIDTSIFPQRMVVDYVRVYAWNG